MVSEPEIYVRIKKFLSDKNWQLLGGEPPNGTNVIPRIELKDPNYSGKGSKGSKKIDLICFKAKYFLLNELKAKYNYSDVKKLNEIKGEKKWRNAIIEALREKKILEKSNIILNEDEYIDTPKYFIKSISYSNGKNQPEDFIVFFVESNEISIKFGKSVEDSVKELFDI